MNDKFWNIENKKFIIISSIILLIGFCILTSSLTHESFWMDECYVGIVTEYPLTDIIKCLKYDFHPPLYYIIIHIVRIFGGNSIFIIRLCSVIGLIALASLGIGPIKRIFGNKTGLIYILFILTTPVLFMMGQEARMYTYAAFFINGTVLYGLLALKEDKRSDWIKYGLFSLGACYTHYYTLFTTVVISLFFFIWLIIKDPKKLKTFFITIYIVFLCYLPWIPIFIFQLSRALNEGFWIPPLTPLNIWRLFILPFGDKVAYTKGMFRLRPYISGIAFIIIVFGLIKMIFNKQKGYLINLFIFSLYASIILVAIITSIVYHPIIQGRYVITILGLFVINLTVGLSSIKNKFLFTGVTIFFLALILPSTYLIYHERFNGPIDEVVSYIKPIYKESTIFIYFNYINLGTFCYYFPKNTHYMYDPNILSKIKYGHCLKGPYFYGSWSDDYLNNSSDIWLITNFDDSQEDILSNEFIKSKKLIPISNKSTFTLPYSWHKLSVQQFIYETDKLNTPTKLNEYLSGDWFYYNDSISSGKSKIIINGKETKEFKKSKEYINSKEKDVAVLAGRVTTDFNYGYIGMYYKPDDKSLKMLKISEGIKFKAAGDKKKYKCMLEIDNVKDYDYHYVEFNPGKNPEEFIFYFTDFNQEGWGKKVEFNKDLITQISFQTVGQPHKKVLLKIFDLELLK